MCWLDSWAKQCLDLFKMKMILHSSMRSQPVYTVRMFGPLDTTSYNTPQYIVVSNLRYSIQLQLGFWFPLMLYVSHTLCQCIPKWQCHMSLPCVSAVKVVVNQFLLKMFLWTSESKTCVSRLCGTDYVAGHFHKTYWTFNLVVFYNLMLLFRFQLLNYKEEN